MSPRSRKRGNRSGKSGGRRPDQRRGPKRGRGGPSKPKPEEFWGDASALPASRRDVRITDDPSAVARSLGPPPLPGHEVIAEHYFAAVYQRSVALAGALAAAGDLISPDELEDVAG
jgi:hypothetical protein